MKIQDNAYVALEYKLTLDSGEVVDESSADTPLGFVFGKGQIIPGLEKGIAGMAAGDSTQVTVEAAEGYGEARDELKQQLPRSNFPEDVKIEPGMTFEAMTPHGPMRFKVEAVDDDNVVADLNHPLAGEKLTFDVKIAEVREATEEESNPPDHGCDGSHDCSSCHSH